MKSSLWIVIVLVTGIVGFLVGYSVSSSTTGGVAAKAGEGGAHKAADPAPGYGAEPAATKTVSGGGYK